MKKKVILITGCSSGFGYETAKLLSLHGHTVYAGVRSEKDIKVFGDAKISTFLLDVTWSQEKITNVVSKIFDKETKIDVLVNNAGFGYLGTVGSFTADEVKEQFETNFFGQFKMIKGVLPGMRKRKNGLIINISSIAGLYTSAFYGIYSSSKFALEALTLALRVEESVNGINIVSVNPSSHETKFWPNAKFPKTHEPLNKTIADKIHGKLSYFRGNPINVANVVEKIINTDNPRKNYLVGISAYAVNFVLKLTPQRVVDFVSKKVMANLNRTT